MRLPPEQGLSSPEETLPGWEVGSLEESVLQDPLHSTQCLDHICAVVVQVPELPIMALMCPPKRVLFQNLYTTGKGCQGKEALHPAQLFNPAAPTLKISLMLGIKMPVLISKLYDALVEKGGLTQNVNSQWTNQPGFKRRYLTAFYWSVF